MKSNQAKVGTVNYKYACCANCRFLDKTKAGLNLGHGVIDGQCTFPTVEKRKPTVINAAMSGCIHHAY